MTELRTEAPLRESGQFSLTNAGWRESYAKWLRVSDLVVITSVVALAHVWRVDKVDVALPDTTLNYGVVSLLVIAGWSAALGIQRSRAPRILGLGLEEYRRVWTATLWTFGGVAVVVTLFKIGIARGYLAIAFPVGLILLTLSRWLARTYVTRLRRQGQFMSNVLAVGQPAAVVKLAESMARHPMDGYRVVGACLSERPGGDTIEVPRMGPLRTFSYFGDIAPAVRASGADTVALISGQTGPDEIRDLSWQLEKLQVELIVSPGVFDVAVPRLTVRPLRGLPLIHVDKPQYSGAKRFEKRVFDVCFSLVVLTAAMPILLAAGIAIKLTSRGPVFYVAERIGQDGKPFQMIKFRSMVVDADRHVDSLANQNDAGGPLFKIRSDPRVTPIGRLIRRYSIDELPQFINVLKKDMSVVGPRPPLPVEVARYDDITRRRLLVRPGITGMWQISGRSDLSWEDSVRLDLSYVENWSMTGDLLIAVSTVKAVATADGAY